MTTTSLPFGELLKTWRSRRKLSQQELARRLGKHLNTIGGWERGDRLPDSKAMVLELARVLHLDEDETRQLLAASLTSLSTSWLVPYPRNPFFTGRRSLLERLHQQLSQQAIALSQSYALSGLGGIGKSQLALEYAYRYASAYHAVFWVAAETIETLSASFSSIADLLGLPEARETTQQKLVAAVLRWFATHKEWLLIFDNVEDLAMLKAYLPAARQGAVLITTRLHTLEGLAHPLELATFSRAEALRFLLKRAQLADPALPLDQVPREVLRTASAWSKQWTVCPWRWTRQRPTSSAPAAASSTTCVSSSATGGDCWPSARWRPIIRTR
jgi:transcriptional regulator with XRE-family HTH domain